MTDPWAVVRNYAFAAMGQCFGGEIVSPVPDKGKLPPVSLSNALCPEPGCAYEFFEMFWRVHGIVRVVIRRDGVLLAETVIGDNPRYNWMAFADPLTVRPGQRLVLEFGAAEPMVQSEACVVLFGRRLSEEKKP